MYKKIIIASVICSCFLLAFFSLYSFSEATADEIISAESETSGVSSGAVTRNAGPQQLDEETALRLRTDYLTKLNSSSSYDTYKLDDIWVQVYFGTFSGREIVYMGAPIDYPAVLVTKEIAGYQFIFGSPQPLYAHCGSDFIWLEQAYETGLLTKEDIFQIRLLVNPGSSTD